MPTQQPAIRQSFQLMNSMNTTSMVLFSSSTSVTSSTLMSTLTLSGAPEES